MQGTEQGYVTKPVEEADLEAVVGVAVRAFAHDPLFSRIWLTWRTPR